MNFKTTVEREKAEARQILPYSFDVLGIVKAIDVDELIEKAMTNAALAVVEEIENELKEANEGVPRSEYESGFDYGLDVALKLVTTIKASLTTKE